MGNIKTPSQYASGKDTFSDNLVGFQVVDGSSQMTNTSFTVDRIIPEKDSKTFHTNPFSDFLTLDTINQENVEIQNTSSKTVSSSSNKIKFYDSKNDGAKSLYGSLSSRLSVSVQNIIEKFPAALYIDTTSPFKSTENTAESVLYNRYLNITEFTIQKSVIFNPFDITLIEPKSFVKIQKVNNIRNFYSSYKKYVLDISGKTYNIHHYTEPDRDNKITLQVYGDCFSGTSGYTESFLIRPNNGLVEEFYNSLDELEIILLDRETFPKYQGKFRVPRDLEQGARTELITEVVTWPTTKDNWNLQLVGIDFEYYLERLKAIGDDIDNYKSNLIVRFLTAPQLFEFDTEEKKAEAVFQIYGQSFDKVKKFIDNIAFMRNVTYDKINNVPDLLLKNLAVTLGLDTIGLFDEKSLQDSLYTRDVNQYIGLNLGKNLVEAEYEFYRRLLVNLAYLYKSKGTRQAIEFFLKFIGAPEPMIRFDEFVYKVNGPLPKTTYETDIWNAIQGRYLSYTTEYSGGTYVPEIGNYTGGTYVVITTTGSTTLTRDEYPVDKITGLPKGLETSDGSIFFQLGAGWYKKTVDHRSHDIIDVLSSDLTGRTKIIKTMSKPFTYGEDYFDYFRKLPGLDYGYDITSQIDNSKTELVLSEEQSRYTLNRKNINLFLSADRAIDYDIYTKSRNIPLTFGDLEPQTGRTFAEFLSDSLSDIIKNTNVIRYKRYYQSLSDVYNEYLNSTQFTPYNYIKINEFINRMSPYWTEIIDQFIPSTTLWMGGNVIENGLFNRSKFFYRKPCTPYEFIENLYPDFNSVTAEDLETIIGGGTTKGIDVGEDHLRQTFILNGLTYVLYINVNGNIFSGTTLPIIEDLFSGFTPTADCTSLETGTTYIPLICEYKDWLNINVESIKLKWIDGIQNLVNEINSQTSSTGVSLTVVFFTDINGVEKIKFTLMNERCVEGDNIDFYFEPFYDIPTQECDLRVEISTPTGQTFIGLIDECRLKSDVYIKIINNNFDGNGGFVTGIEGLNPPEDWPINIYITSGTTCTGLTETVSACTNCGYIELNIEPIIKTAESCTYMLSGVTETDVFDIIVADASNCEQKFRIEGLQPKIEDVNGVSGYTIHPKVQYKTTDNFGIKKGTIVYKETRPLNLSKWRDLEQSLMYGFIVDTLIDDIVIGDVLVSIKPKESSQISITELREALLNNNSLDFTFDYIRVEVTNIECLSSIKTSIINNDFELLPTSKLLVYSNINENLERVPAQFMYKYPEDLYIKSTGDTSVPCCRDTHFNEDITDKIFNQYGFLLDVTSVDLNYCDGGIFYRIDYEELEPLVRAEGVDPPIDMNVREKIVLITGGYSGVTLPNSNRIIVSYEKEEFKCLDMNIQHYYVNSDCTYVPSIEELERNVCEMGDCDPLECLPFEAEFIESTLLGCLSSTTFIIQYNEELNPCPHNHICDNATFYLMADNINIGTVYLSNTGGLNDQFNYPPDAPIGYIGPNRYNEIILTPEQALEISSGAVGGFVTFSLVCALPPNPPYYPTGCHEDVTWIQMIRDGETVFNGCPDGNFITINPCTGEIQE